MLQHLWLIPILPFAGFLTLAIAGSRMSRNQVAFIGVGSVGASAVLALLVAMEFLASPIPYTQTLCNWIQVGRFTPSIAFYLDPLALIMMVVVAFVSFLIHLYSVESMRDEEGYSRFFAYMNLFVGSMLTLVLADNLLLLYLGWEGVGLCSYLLIGFWYKDVINGAAARKAFIVTRIGDTALAIGLFLLFQHLGTLDIQELLRLAVQQWPVGSGLATTAALLLLGGAVGKSAQLPLQTWLPDAMAGPTPVSALIHAATMVTAGVYLITRTHLLYELAPTAQLAVAIIGAVTLLLAGCSALTQWDIKRVLAYSTISQIGYMFLALGVGAWSAAIFHFMTHAFFKSLLFLAAGVVIDALHHEHDLCKMGGLRSQLPVTFWTFLIGACSLAALPFVTAGFYSKDLILEKAWLGAPWLWAAGLAGALLTSLYTFRMVFLTFFGTAQQQVSKKPGLCIQLPLVVLAVLSVVSGWLTVPEFLQVSLPVSYRPGVELGLKITAGAVSVTGIYLAFLLFLRHRWFMEKMGKAPIIRMFHQFWSVGWGFDCLYDWLVVRPYLWLARVDKNDVVDLVYTGVARLSLASHRALSKSQTGQVRWYAAGIAVGAIIILLIIVVLL